MSKRFVDFLMAENKRLETALEHVRDMAQAMVDEDAPAALSEHNVQNIITRVAQALENG